MTFIIHFATIGCCVKIICSWTIRLCQRMVCHPIHWHDGFSSSWIDNQRLWQRRPGGFLKLAQVRIALLEEIDVCICQIWKNVHLASWWWGFAFVSTAFHQPHNNCICNWHLLPGRTVLIPKQSGVVSLSRFSSSGSRKNVMFVLVDVCPLMRLRLATCMTGTHQSLSLMVSSWVDISITRTSYCFESRSKLFVPTTFAWSVPTFFHSCSRCRCLFHLCPSLFLSANRTTHHLNFLMCWSRQRSNLVLVVMCAHSCSELGNCPTLRVSLTEYSGWSCQDLVPVFVLVQCFLCPLVRRQMCCFWKQGPYLPLCEAQLCLRQLVFPSLCSGSLGPLSCTRLWRWRWALVLLETVEKILWPTSWWRSASDKILQSWWVASFLGVDWQWRLRIAHSLRKTGRWVGTKLLLLSLEVSTISRAFPAVSLCIQRCMCLSNSATFSAPDR